MRFITIFGYLGILLVLSCNSTSSLEQEISKIPIVFHVERFDLAFKNAKPKDLPKLKTAYPFLFSKRIPDSIWTKRMADTLQHELLTEVEDAFSNLNTTKNDIKRLFQHLKFYDKTFSVPRVITLTNDVDYRNKTIVNDTLVLIALDNFLGEAHPFYQNLPRYIAAKMVPNQILPKVAEGYAKNYIGQGKQKTFLDIMIYYGKQLYFKDVMIPFVSDAEKIGYTDDELAWATANESPIWSYFMEKELLYSTDSKLVNRFIANAPYSKFYLELDSESPGQLGRYMGWQIVKAYAMASGESMMTILQKDPETIFRNSKFKPKR